MRDNHQNRFKLITLGFVAFVTSFGAHVVAVNLAVYAKQVGAGLAVIGLLIAVYDFAEIIAKPVFGYLAGSFKELGDMLGPLLIGLLAQAFGLKVGFVVCGLLGFMALSLPRFVRPRAAEPLHDAL